MKLFPIAVVACHFAARDQLCRTTVERLNMSLRRVEVAAGYAEEPHRFVFIVTGDAPYEPGSKTLAELMREWLIREGIPQEDIACAVGGTGSLAEPAVAIATLQQRFPAARELTVISSDWQLWIGRPFWERTAKQHSLRVRYLGLTWTGGWRTHLVYAAYALLIRIALPTRFWPLLEQFLTSRVYKPRKQGFKLNGCA